MNKVLVLKGKPFTQEGRKNTGGGIDMNSKKNVTTSELIRLSEQIDEIIKYWGAKNKPFNGVFISVYYNKIVSKTNRISGLFKQKESNNAIVGAKFNDDKTKHIITYYLDLSDLLKSVVLLKRSSVVLEEKFDGKITQKTLKDDKNFPNEMFIDTDIAKTTFRSIISDVSYIDGFDVEEADLKPVESLVTLYDTEKNTKQLLEEIGINVLSSRIIGNRTVFLDTNQIKTLLRKAPYLIAMSAVDFTEIETRNQNDSQFKTAEKITIPSPKNEPTIGVIDTLFDNRVYFSEWVESTDMVDKNIPRAENLTDDYRHGTEICSIIVDGPRLNPSLDDNCGRFKVRHFGVAIAGGFSSFSIIKKIEQIVISNPDIKVWNFSLGSMYEINDNFISAEAAILDQIQYENDVIFVISGTNRGKRNKDSIKIGTPADSINSIVVNSIDENGKPAKYSRKGPALSFFTKPDISYFGGTSDNLINVCGPVGKETAYGTSYAAPWIARKLSFLIDVLGFSREVAKALIIESSKGWDGVPSDSEISLVGHGVVPIKIDDVLSSNEDEIKFIVSGISEKWNTYNYYFPVPLLEEKFPFVARAVMCYFPKCNRAQGVDYTNTELSLHFGRLDSERKGIKDIKNDNQNRDLDDDEKPFYVYEKTARKEYRKWDNVKYKLEKFSNRKQAKQLLNKKNKNWGMEIKTTNRLNSYDGTGLKFGVVVTLKEINGINRIDEFIKSSILEGWIVDKIDIKQKVKIREKAHEKIDLD